MGASRCPPSPRQPRALACSQPCRGPSPSHSVPRAGDTTPAVSLGLVTAAAAEPAAGAGGHAPSPVLTSRGCAWPWHGETEAWSGTRGTRPSGGDVVAAPTSSAAAMPGAAQPGPSTAIYLSWLARRAGGRAVTRRLLNEGRRMAPGGSGCSGGEQWRQSPAPNGFSCFFLPLLFLGMTPVEAASPQDWGACDRLRFTVSLPGDGDPHGGRVDRG